jgi:ribosomal protein S18 acetylase RimI-like enzyme
MIFIRPLDSSDDFSDLISLSRDFFNEYEAYHKDFFKINELKDQDVIRYFNSFCGQGSRKAFIAVEGKHILGYITAYVKEQANYWRFNRIGEISGLMVKDEYRHQGIAKSLVDEAIKFFTDQGLIYYTVYTAVHNRAGIEFYQKSGLQPLNSTLIGKIEPK